MTKLVLTDIANLENENTVVAAFRANNTAITAALENTLSRDGTLPNQMGDNLDMNSNRILNLPDPISNSEPLRRSDLLSFVGGTLNIHSIPVGGTTGQVLTKTTNSDYAVSWTPGVSILTATSTATSGYTNGQILGSNGSTLSVYSVSGSGNVVLTASPTLTGTPLAPTASVRANTTQIATTAYVDNQTRDIATGARTYYVRTDGNDSNSGLVDNAGGAFLTIAHALSLAAGLDISLYQLTIQIDAGTWSTPIVLPKVLVGALPPILTGVGSTTIISTTSTAILNDGAGAWQINNMKLTTSSAGIGLDVKNGGVIKFQGVEFGAIFAYGISCSAGGAVTATGNYTVSGSAQIHLLANLGEITVPTGIVVTVSGTPAFSLGFAFANRLGLILTQGATFSGSATGPRYFAGLNAVIDTSGGGASFFPGNSGGTTATGGQYN